MAHRPRLNARNAADIRTLHFALDARMSEFDERGIVAEDCLICREHRLEVALQGDHLVATEHLVAFHLPPWPPPAEDVYLGYLMLTPRRHVAGFADLKGDESAAV
jgi:hypothetical protein